MGSVAAGAGGTGARARWRVAAALQCAPSPAASLPFANTHAVKAPPTTIPMACGQGKRRLRLGFGTHRARQGAEENACVRAHWQCVLPPATC